MKSIGILSDTHGFLHPHVLKHFRKCDEVWHAGDIGSIAVLDQLEQLTKVRAVWGNIDAQEVRFRTEKVLRFECEGMRVMLTHIGGYPGKYAPGIRQEIMTHQPNLFVCGHSHLLKVQYDANLHTFCINPGAAGRYGAQLVSTLVRIEIDNGKINDLEVIELSK